MDNRIIIEMTSIQTVDGQADTNRLTYHGRYQETDGRAILQYMQVDEMGRTRNKLELWDGGCRMTTTGDMGRVMEFIPGKRTSTRMHTPMGCMDMDIVTHAYELDVIKEGEPHMQILLVYDLYGSGSLLAENRLEVRVQPAEK